MFIAHFRLTAMALFVVACADDVPPAPATADDFPSTGFVVDGDGDVAAVLAVGDDDVPLGRHLVRWSGDELTRQQGPLITTRGPVAVGLDGDGARLVFGDAGRLVVFDGDTGARLASVNVFKATERWR